MEDDGTTDGRDGPDPTRCKVGRLIAEYDLTDAGDRLESFWTGEREERMSLRELATYFNTRLLDSVLERHGVRPLDGEVENLYELLTDADRSPGVRAEAESRLERDGIDVDALRDDFVSHQAVHTYLTEYRNVDHGSGQEETSSVATTAETIRRLQGRTAAVTRNGVTDLANAGHVTVGDFEVLTNVRLFCNDCQTQYELAEFLDRGGCDCRAE